MTLDRPEQVESTKGKAGHEKAAQEIKPDHKLHDLLQSNSAVKADMVRQLMALGLSEEAANRILRKDK
ncbi:MAG: hypothetical protein JW943_08210 [Deltaproteobacteria bacterium]|nr:hypothetical protein [Deltaproteobacteria bacterium]